MRHPTTRSTCAQPGRRLPGFGSAVSTAINCRILSASPATTATRSSSDDQRNFYQELRLLIERYQRADLWNGGLFYSHLSENVPESIIDPTLNQEVLNWTGRQQFGAAFRRSPAVPERTHIQRPDRAGRRQADRGLR